MVTGLPANGGGGGPGGGKAKEHADIERELERFLGNGTRLAFQNSPGMVLHRKATLRSGIAQHSKMTGGIH
jgi:hypothetical protein